MPNSDTRAGDVTWHESLAALLRRDLIEHPARWSDADLARFLEVSSKLLDERGGIDAKPEDESTSPATPPNNRPDAISLESYGRELGKMSRSDLIGTYALAAGAAMGMAMFGANVHNTAVELLGRAGETINTAILVGVATWYRREQAVNAAILVGVSWVLARLVGAWCATLLASAQYGGWSAPGTFMLDCSDCRLPYLKRFSLAACSCSCCVASHRRSRRRAQAHRKMIRIAQALDGGRCAPMVHEAPGLAVRVLMRTLPVCRDARRPA